MKFKGCKLTLRKRRGLSSVVGALLFVVLMVATFAVLGVALNTQTDIVSTGRDVAEIGLKKQQERFVINSITQLPSESLQVNVANKGQNPSEIFTLVITNSSDVLNGYPTKTIDIPSDTSFLTPDSNNPDDIVRTLNLKMDNNPTQELYQFKIISSLGTIEKLFVTCQNGACGIIAGGAEGGGLFAQFLMDGPNAINTKNSTAIMFVTNTGNVTLNDVAPIIACSSMWSVSPDVGGTADINPCELKPTSIAKMKVGQTVIFKWDGKVTGEINDEFSFCNQARGTDPDLPLDPVNSNPVCDEVTVIDPNDCGGCDDGSDGDDDPLDDRFITRPELFLTIPSPFGEPGGGPAGPDPPIGRALWGANVVNPTDTVMLIHKITITAFAPTANSNILIIADGGSDDLNCNPQDISPGNGTIPGTQLQESGFWSCPGENTIMWKNYGNPIILQPQSSFPFMVKLEAEIPISNDAESVLVDSTVFTTSGSFGKGNYQTTIYDNGLYGNIYGTSDWTDPLNYDNIETSRLNIPSGSYQKFSFVLADNDLNPDTSISDTSSIVINVPRTWTQVNVTASETTGIDTVTPGEPSIVIHPDNTTQIIAQLTDLVGDEANEEAIVLTFEVFAPVVSRDKLMVMYTLANGEGTNGNSVGPLSEYILAVVP